VDAPVSPPDCLTPRFPAVATRAGHYESIYLVASHPSAPVSVWIRYTVHKQPGRRPTGSIWFTLFEDGRPTAVKVTDDDVRAGTGSQLLAVGGYGAVRRDGATGAVSGRHTDASWALRFEPLDAELRHLPYGWLYRAPLPRTKSTSPYPAMRVSGSVVLNGRELTLDGWRGMLGHNWGAEHAHRWIWLRGAGFAEAPEGWLDVVIGRVKVGPSTTPWIANGAFAPDGRKGRRHRIGGLLRRITVQERPDGCDLVLPGDGMTLTVTVTAPIATSVGWEYADPSGGRHQVRNCSTAGLAVRIGRGHASPGGTPEELHTAHGGVYELGSATFDPSVAMQPYTDG
jgi:hypothetical protein